MYGLQLSSAELRRTSLYQRFVLVFPGFSHILYILLSFFSTNFMFPLNFQIEYASARMISDGALKTVAKELQSPQGCDCTGMSSLRRLDGPSGHVCLTFGPTSGRMPRRVEMCLPPEDLETTG